MDHYSVKCINPLRRTQYMVDRVGSRP